MPNTMMINVVGADRSVGPQWESLPIRERIDGPCDNPQWESLPIHDDTLLSARADTPIRPYTLATVSIHCIRRADGVVVDSLYSARRAIAQPTPTPHTASAP